ncbi:MAG TPA: response regulator [Allocoleopsis sp.]
MTKILVIEDDKPILDNLVDMLTMEDFDVIYADNGLEGINLAIAEIPDLILCDIMMPEFDGYYVLNSLRSNGITKDIPFMFLTAKADIVFVRQGIQMGANQYLTKPFTRNELLKSIKQLIINN